LTVNLDAGTYALIRNIWDEEEQEAPATGRDENGLHGQ
jgi:hypothetical protein